MKRFICLLLVAACVCLTAEGKRAKVVVPSAYDQPSYIVNEDGSVSFTYCGPARHVRVMGDFQYRGKDSTRYNDHSRKLKMRKGSDGCFHVTTPPLVPETYTYCFRVNGKRRPDPLNNDTSWQRLHLWNIVSVGGSELADRYTPSAAQGEMVRTSWYCSEEKQTRSVNIYLPAAYVQAEPDDTTRFPVLYLLHGINGYEGSWTERGRVIQIVENLIADSLIRPFVIVMPDCNMGPQEGHPSHHTLWNNVVHYPRLCRDHSLEHGLSDLMQMIDSTYRVSDKRAVAGLSSGARIAANIVNQYPDCFEAIGMFSPVAYKSQVPTPEVHDTRYYIYMGTDDMFLNNGRHFSQRLTQSGKEHCYTETGGGHYWRNWRAYLLDFIQHWAQQE